jgi:cytochrome c oxidase cbb3-type subunit 3
MTLAGAAFVAAGFLLDQPALGQAPPRTPPWDSGQSPAAQPRPKTGNPQEYPAAQIQTGAFRFVSQCGFCHGRDAAGGETGPDLTRSSVVAEDRRGDKITPLVRAGRADRGMPAFTLNDTDLEAIVAFIHDQKTKFDSFSGGRRAVDPEDLASGNAEAGRRYFNGVGACVRCHSATGDLAGVASRYRGLELLERMLYPNGRPQPAPPKVTLTLASGETLVAPLAAQDEFTIAVLSPSGERQTYDKTAVKFAIDEPLSMHFNQLGKYTDTDMHDVFAYLDTLK